MALVGPLPPGLPSLVIPQPSVSLPLTVVFLQGGLGGPFVSYGSTFSSAFCWVDVGMQPAGTCVCLSVELSNHLVMLRDAGRWRAGFLASWNLPSVANLSTAWPLSTSYRFPDVKKKKKTKDPLMYNVVFLPAYLISDCFTELVSKLDMSCFNTVHSPVWPWGAGRACDGCRCF